MDDFKEPLEVASLLAGFERPWFVAGGWAIDLYLGEVTRRHQDLEIAILRRDQHLLRQHLRGWEFKQVKRVPGKAQGSLEPWSEDEWLELPTHEIHASRAGGDLVTLEVLLNESSGGEWRFRRNPEITRPLSLVGKCSQIGIPFLAPEIVLLYKAKNPSAHDDADFRKVRRLLAREPRTWLRHALESCTRSHRWLALI